MSLPLDRRRFLQHAAAAAAGLGLGTVAAKEKPAVTIPLVDTHQHLWDLSKFTLPWLKNEKALATSHVMSDYLKATEGLNVVKAVYMEVDVDPSQQGAEVEYITDVCRRKIGPTVAAVVSGRPASDGFKDYLNRFQGNKYIKGIRQVLHGSTTPPGYCLDDKFIRGIRLLGERGLSFDLCMRPGELTDAGKLIDACPDTRFILDHCGNARVPDKDRTQWQKDMAALAKRPQLVCKVSGIVASAKPGAWTAADLAPIVNHTLDTFGPDRVMFGGDWPVCTLAATYRQWVEALQAIVHERSAEQQKKLFHDNAVRFYGLT